MLRRSSPQPVTFRWRRPACRFTFTGTGVSRRCAPRWHLMGSSWGNARGTTPPIRSQLRLRAPCACSSPCPPSGNRWWPYRRIHPRDSDAGVGRPLGGEPATDAAGWTCDTRVVPQGRIGRCDRCFVRPNVRRFLTDHWFDDAARSGTLEQDAGEDLEESEQNRVGPCKDREHKNSRRRPHQNDRYRTPRRSHRVRCVRPGRPGSRQPNHGTSRPFPR